MRTIVKRYFILNAPTGNSAISSDNSSNTHFSEDLLDQHGFLYENKYNKRLKNIQDIVSGKGALLFAECGMGKSYVMENLQQSFSPEITWAITLSEYQGDPSGLFKDISTLDDNIKNIFIDGLDEAVELINPLLRGLKTISFHPKIFLASRNIPQTKVLAKELSLPLYSLLPLSQKNIFTMAQEKQVPDKEFIEQVIHIRLGAVCARPLGCQLLLSAYSRDKLANTQSDELWHQAILGLCAENDSDSRCLLDSPVVPPNTCFKYASQIALILKLSGVSVINRISSTQPNSKAVDFSLYEDTFTGEVFNDVLGRGLFTPTGPNHFQFAHITYFDYLAAVGLDKHIDKRHWKNILLSGDQSSIYPQWEGVASWLAAFNAEWREIVLAIQPELLLISDKSIQAIGAEKICRALIKRADGLDYWQQNDITLRIRLSKLKCRETTAILQKFLEAPSSTAALEMAINIIRECSITELELYLTKKFCDPSADTSLRKSIGYALVDFASDNARTACKVILEQEDCPLDLKGLLFRMAWPHLISIEEIEPHLVFEDRNIIDAYYWWITYDLFDSLLTLSKDQCIDLLKWVSKDIKRNNNDHRNPILDLKRRIFTSCWGKYDTPEIYSVLAIGYVEFQKAGVTPFIDESIYEVPEKLIYTKKMFLKDKGKRYYFADYLMNAAEITGNELTYQNPWPILNENDIAHVFTKIDNEEGELRQKWLRCLHCLQYYIPLPEMSEHLNKIHKRFPQILTVSAEEIIQHREKENQRNLALELTHENSRKDATLKRRQSQESSIQQIKKLLAEGDASTHFCGIIHFFITETSVNIIDFSDTEIWQAFTADEISKLVLAARDFLTTVTPPGDIRRACPRAFFMLYKENNPEFKKLSEEAWRKFALELFEYSYYDDDNILYPIFEYMADVYPVVFTEALIQTIKNGARERHSYNFEKFKDILSPKVCKDIAMICTDNTLSDGQCFLTLNTLQKISHEVTKKFLEREVLASNKPISEYGFRIIILLIDYWPEKIDQLINHIESEPKWGKQWLEDVINMNNFVYPLVPIFKRAKLDELKRFYIWLHNNYPVADKPAHNKTYSPTALDNIYDFIEKLFNCIMEFPETGVVAVLREIHLKFPSDNWMLDCILRAKKIELKLKNPVHDEQTIKKLMTRNSLGELVSSPQGLLDVILECLDDYQKHLTGKENPRVEDLWNYNKNALTHKTEEEFSDHLKDYLERKIGTATIINREVQLNRGRNGESGARTDIWINTFSKEPSSKISLCIEVKGSWNSSTPTAMREQLVDKYMGAGGADAGIYLAGWFQSKNYPQKTQWKNNRDKAIADLQLQAQILKSEGNLIASKVISCDYRL